MSDDASPERIERWETLSQAFAAYRYPLENLALVQRFVDHVGVKHFESVPSRSYIRAIRRTGGRPVFINSGYTGGLPSEAEIVDAVGDVDRDTDGREWWMVHPVNKIRDGGGPKRRVEDRDYGFCPNCFMALPASGVCDGCGP